MSKVLDINEVKLQDIHLVEAAAGTGKTYNITAFYVRLIMEKGLQVDQILVVTYTRAATRELRERIDHRLRTALAVLRGAISPDDCDDFIKSINQKFQGDHLAEERLSQAIHDLDLAAIYTIHGFCRQVLQDQVFESGSLHDVEFVTDESELQAEVHDDLWLEMIRWAEADAVRMPAFQFLLDEIKEPDGLQNYTSTVKGKPFIELYGQNHRDPDEICRDYQQIWDELKHFWNPDSLHKLLSDNTFIQQKSFKKNTTPRWIAAMQELLQQDSPPPNPSAVFDKFTNFTTEYIEQYRTDQPLPEEFEQHYRFFDLCGQLHELASSGELKQVLLNQVADRYRRLYEQAKQQKKVRSYDDLLIALNHALNQDSLVSILQKQFPAALVDEFQDTDPIQFEIFDKIYLRASQKSDVLLFLIGDPKQSIYSFRGADIFTYIAAKNKVTHHWTLDKNYRSAESLVNAVNHLFGKNGKSPFLLDEIGFQPIAGQMGDDETEITGDLPHQPLQFLFSPDEDTVNKEEGLRRTAREAATEIARLLAQPDQFRINGEPIQAKDIAVLVGRHHEGELIKQQLTHRGIRSVDQSRSSVYQSREADYILMLLQVLRDPQNAALVRALLSSRIVGFRFSELLELQNREENWLRILDHIRQLHELFLRKGFMVMWRKFLSTPLKVTEDEPAVPLEVIMYYTGGERTLTNLMHLAEEINEYARSENRGLDDVIKWMARKFEEAGSNDSEELRLESDRELVKIITMHSSKGLQFPVVFCPFLWVGLDAAKVDPPHVYHHENQRWVDFAGADPQAPERVLKERISEQMRLAYVALTRAQYRCYIGWAPYNKQQLAPLSGLIFGSDHLKQVIEQGHNNQPIVLSDDLKKQAESEFIGVTEPGEPEPSRISGNQGTPDLKYEPLQWENGRIQPSWYITSYSGMKQGRQTEPEGPFADEGIWDEEQPTRPESASQKRNLFTFPRGARPGMFLHQIFEEIRFTDTPEAIEPVIDGLLDEYQFEQEWAPVIKSMTRQTLETPVLQDDATWTLSKLNENQCVREMEFHFRIPEADIADVERIINGETGVQRKSSEYKGFLKGYIDLVFEHRGKYYILDYKSDYMGDQIEDYHPDVLRNHMFERGYHLQYHIYTVALMRYLKTRIDGFDLRSHFGGAIYLYLRGLQGGNGIYFDRPSSEIINNLDSYLQSQP